jgi:prepilin-type N-terminal cleavage/methylation domain-containing protein
MKKRNFSRLLSLGDYVSNNRGLTLIEVIVSVVMGGILLYGLFIVYEYTLEIWKFEEARYVMIRDAMRVENELRRDLGNASMVEHDNGYGGHGTMVRTYHQRGDIKYVNKFFLYQGRFLKDGKFLVFGKDESETELATFRFFPLISETTSPGQGVEVVNVAFEANNDYNRRLLNYSITLQNKYEDKYTIKGWIKCYGRG